MGGRKSYSIDDIVGKSPEIRKRKKDLIRSVESEEPERITQTSIELFTKSDKASNDFASIVDTLDFIEENVSKPPLNYDERKKLAAKYWSKIRKEKDIKISPELNKIFVKSLAKVIRRGVHK